MNSEKKSVYCCSNVCPRFQMGCCCRNSKHLHVCGSLDAAKREVSIRCCGCKQLIRKSARCRLTGRDSRGAAGCGERATSPSPSLPSLLFLLHCHPLLSHQRLPGRQGGHNRASPAPSCLSSSSFPLPIGSECHFSSPCCTCTFHFSVFSSPFLTSTSLLLAELPPHRFLIS